MRLPDEYRASLEAPPPATLIALLAPGADMPTLDDALSLLERSSDVLDVAPLESAGSSGEPPYWEVEIEVAGAEPGETEAVHAWLEPAPQELMSEGIEWRGVTASDWERARESAWAIVVSTHFSATALRDFHRLVRLLSALAPEAVLVYDLDALTPRSGHWLHEVASASTPPSPSVLFTVHDVAPEDGSHWLHTHGLARCGALELDVLDVPAEGAGLIGQLVNAVASLFMERGIPEPDEPFLAGENLELVWLPWQRAIERLPNLTTGGANERDESHAGARGVLLRPESYASPADYLQILRENPLLYISDMETERMSLLASERLPRFLRLLSRHAGESGWMFLVKLGYAVDGAGSPSDREHLWFQVHSYDAGDVDATLLNQPYRIERFAEGQRGTHSLDRLSDWAILCPKGRFDANSIAELERMLVGRVDAH